MNKEFIPYEQALALKELGFDEPCLGYYTHNEKLCSYGSNEINIEYLFCTHKDIYKTYSLAPTFSQAFRWFREKYALDSYIRPNVVIDVPKTYQFNIDDNTDDIWYGTYEEAELACLEKLIKIVEQTNAEMTDHGVYK